MVDFLVDVVVFRKFKGGTASILSRIPMLRYLYLWGTIDVSGKSLAASLKQVRERGGRAGGGRVTGNERARQKMYAWVD